LLNSEAPPFSAGMEATLSFVVLAPAFAFLALMVYDKVKGKPKRAPDATPSEIAMASPGPASFDLSAPVSAFD
jgi:hypothetical protein